MRNYKQERDMSIKKFLIKGNLIFVLSLLISGAVSGQSLNEGKKLFENHKYAEAEKMFLSLCEKENKPVNFFETGKILLILNKIDEAKSYFSKAANADKENLLYQAGEGFIALKAKDTAKANAVFNKIVENDEYDTPAIYLEIADMYNKLSITDNKFAVNLLLNYKNSKKYKKSAEFFLIMGYLNSNGSNASLAIENFNNAIYFDDELVEPYLAIAKIYQKIKNYTDAESNLNTALNLDTTFAPTYLEYSEFYSNTKQYEKAVTSYKKYMDLSEVTENKKAEYATLLFLAKMYQESINEIKDIINTKYFDKQLSHILAYNYFFVNDYNEGVKAFEKYFKTIPENEITATDYEYYGKLNMGINIDSTALQSLNKAVNMDSSKTILYGDIAALYFKMKKWDDAANNYKLKIAATGKLSLKEYFDLGRCYMIKKDYNNADSTYAKVIEIKPDFPLGYLMSARAKSSIDTTSELGLAKANYEKFIELAEKSSTPEKYKADLIEAYSYLGYFYYLKKEDPAYSTNWQELFKQNWNKVLVLDPNNVQAKEALKTVK